MNFLTFEETKEVLDKCVRSQFKRDGKTVVSWTREEQNHFHKKTVQITVAEAVHLGKDTILEIDGDVWYGKQALELMGLKKRFDENVNRV